MRKRTELAVHSLWTRCACLSVVLIALPVSLAADHTGDLAQQPATSTPIMALSANLLTFYNASVGQTTAPQTATITNTGTAQLNTPSFAISGVNSSEFALNTSTCGLPIPSGSVCVISVTFTPQSSGMQTALITITDNAVNSPLTISLVGTGQMPALTLSTMSLAFGYQILNLTAAPQALTVTNSGTAALSFSGVAIAGANSTDFNLAGNTCGSTVAPGVNCSILVAFTPTALGTRTASLILIDNVAGSPQTIGLAGTGEASAAPVLSATSLAFGNQIVGFSSSPQSVSLTNGGTTPLRIAGVVMSGNNSSDFSFTSNCGGSLATGASCAISATFTPTAFGPRTALISVIDDAGNSPQTINLTGAGESLPAPAISANGVVPLYGAANTIQAGEWSSIYGANLAVGTTLWTGNFPTSLGGTSVQIDGKAAYLSMVSPGQINLQAPDDLKTGTVPVVVITPGGSATSTVTLVQVAPSFCLLDQTHVTGIILRPNGQGTSGGGAYDILGPGGNSLGYPTVAATAGDSVVLFAVGFGPTSPTVPSGRAYSGAAAATNSVQLTIGGTNVTPSFTGLSSAGLYQINVSIPAGLGTGDMPIAAMVSGVQTQTGVVISLQ